MSRLDIKLCEFKYNLSDWNCIEATLSVSLHRLSLVSHAVKQWPLLHLVPKSCGCWLFVCKGFGSSVCILNFCIRLLFVTWHKLVRRQIFCWYIVWSYIVWSSVLYCIMSSCDFVWIFVSWLLSFLVIWPINTNILFISHFMAC